MTVRLARIVKEAQTDADRRALADLLIKTSEDIAP